MIMENDYGLLFLKLYFIFNCNESGFKVDVINKIVVVVRGMEYVLKVFNS